MTEHDVDVVFRVAAMLCSPPPLGLAKSLETLHEPRPVLSKPSHLRLQVPLQQRPGLFIRRRFVRNDSRVVLRQHESQSVIEEGAHLCQVAGVLVDGPFPIGRSPPDAIRGRCPHQFLQQGWRDAKRLDQMLSPHGGIIVTKRGVGAPGRTAARAPDPTPAVETDPCAESSIECVPACGRSAPFTVSASAGLCRARNHLPGRAVQSLSAERVR